MATSSIKFVIVLLIISIQLSLAVEFISAASEHPVTAAANIDNNYNEGAEKVDVNEAAADHNMEEDVAMPQNLCGYKSKTFSGPCLSRRTCAYQCQVVEHAAAGACHFHHVQRHCYCYRYC